MFIVIFYINLFEVRIVLKNGKLVKIMNVILKNFECGFLMSFIYCVFNLWFNFYVEYFKYYGWVMKKGGYKIR